MPGGACMWPPGSKDTMTLDTAICAACRPAVTRTRALLARRTFTSAEWDAEVRRLLERATRAAGGN